MKIERANGRTYKNCSHGRNHVTFDFNYETLTNRAQYVLYFFPFQMDSDSGFIAGDTSFQIKRENGECSTFL